MNRIITSIKSYYGIIYTGGNLMLVTNTEKNNMVKKVVSTMAIENMFLTKEFTNKLIDVANGKISGNDLRKEIAKKHDR